MELVENAALKITLTASANNKVELATVLHEVAKEISKGAVAANVGGLSIEYQFNVEKLVRDAQLRIGADDAGHTCPSCEGRGMRAYNGEPGLWHCYTCKGTGQV